MKNAKNPFELAKSFELAERSELAVPFEKRNFNAEDQTTAYYKGLTNLQGKLPQDLERMCRLYRFTLKQYSQVYFRRR